MEIPGDVTRRTLLRNIALGTLALASGVDNILGQAVSGPPNIVFIMADDLGYADVSCYGRPDISTPNIDGLAAKGVRFLQAYANSAVCSATRTALITGRYQYRLPVGLEEPLGRPRCRPAAGPSYLAVAVEEGRLRNNARREMASWACSRNSVLFKAGTTISTDSAVALSTTTRHAQSKRRFVGRRRPGASDGLSDGSARQPCGGRRQWICEIGPSVSDQSAFQRAALAVGSAGR